jgi:EmrB/QacA subfamily drug resistance transporter
MQAAPTTASPLSVAGRRAATVAVMCGACMGALEATVVGTAMPTVIRELGGLDCYGWVFAAYLIATTATLPVFGKLADVFGRRPVFLLGMGLFVSGSALAGQARSMAWLIAARAVQGLGAGAIQPVGITIAGDLHPPAKRAMVQGWFSTVFGLCSIIGPWLGALLVESGSWRWVFYIPMPVAVLSAGIIGWVLRHERPRAKGRFIDWPGALLLALGVATLLALPTVLVRPNAEIYAPVLAVIAIALGAAFVAVERRAPEPILAPALLRSPVVFAAAATGFFVGGTLLGATTFVPLFVQAMQGGDSASIGAVMTPLSVGWPLGAIIAGRLLPRVGARPLSIFGSSVLGAIGLCMACFFGKSTPTLLPSFFMAMLGVGLGLCTTAMLVAVQGSVAHGERGAATASTVFFRTVGGAVGVAVMTAVLAAALPSFSEAQSLLDPARRALAHAPAGSGALASGLSGVFTLVAGFGLMALYVSFRFPRREMRAA